jgi:hypothetical protein
MDTLFNTGKHIASIIDRTRCDKHKAPNGEPCFHVDFGTRDGYGTGVCNRRIKLAGFNGKISLTSVQLSKGGRKSDAKPRS